MRRRTIHVACTVNRAYLPHCAAMLHSLLSNERRPVEIHLVAAADLDPDSIATLTTMVRSLGGRLSMVEPPPQEWFEPLDSLFSEVLWYRLYLAELMPQLDRVLFLDCDLIVTRPVRDLWGVRLGDDLVAAVTNVFPSPDWARRHCEAIGLEDPAQYFNAGVMLCNLAGWRENQVAERIQRFCMANSSREPGKEFRSLDERAFLEFMGAHPEMLLFADQDAQNAVLASRRRPLHPRWNCTTQLHWLPDGGGVLEPAEVAEALADPVIRHWEGPGVSKPWHPESQAPGRELYLRHRAETPWP